MKKISREGKLKEEWLLEEEDYLISISNMLQEKFLDNPNFVKADNYLTNEIQKKLGQVAGVEDEIEDIIELVCSYLGVEINEFFKTLEG